MSVPKSHMFTTAEAALAYALAAERILGADASFLNQNPASVPIFVSFLFQSLEISIKHVGIESGLFTMLEARSARMRTGHGIAELADLVGEKLSGQPFKPLVQALTYFHTEPNSAEIIHLMIHGAEFEKTRQSYAKRYLGYGEVAVGDFAVVDGLSHWVTAIKQTAVNLPKIVRIVSQWKNSPASSGPFAIWLTTAKQADG